MVEIETIPYDYLDSCSFKANLIERVIMVSKRVLPLYGYHKTLLAVMLRANVFIC